MSLTDLGSLFKAVAGLELSYFLAAMTPPQYIPALTGWNLSPDGHWIVKLMGTALLTQAHTAWTFRNEPHLEVAKGLAFYQMASATVDWCMWLTMPGIFETQQAKNLVIAAIGSHYALGLLLFRAIGLEEKTSKSK